HICTRAFTARPSRPIHPKSTTRTRCTTKRSRRRTVVLARGRSSSSACGPTSRASSTNQEHTMNRRDLFKLAGAAGALGMLGKLRPLAAATPVTKKRLVMVLAQGGWDVTYALDPKVQSTKCDVPVGAKQMFGNLDVFTDASRPNVTAFFQKYAANTAIVRGISVASVAHQECLKRMSTGTRQETSADMAAIVAHDNGNDRPLP